MSHQILVERDSWEWFWACVDHCKGEVAALGYCEPHDDGFIYVNDLFLIPQEVSSGGVDFLEEGLPYAIAKAESEDKLEQLRVCIHSHAGVSTFFSSTDTEMVRKIKESSPMLPWFVSAVFNHKHETYAQVDLFSSPLPGLDHIIFPAEITVEADDEISSQAETEIKQFVKEKTYTKINMKNNKKKDKPDDPNPDWHMSQWDDTQHDMDLREEAMQRNWTVWETTDGMFHFYDHINDAYKGVACGPEVEDSEWMNYLTANYAYGGMPQDNDVVIMEDDDD